ncbi:hypothetical protein RM533_06710 [Croceicoccus sp. F390]|uniref:Uncharacterized protein n=1 Tax=Croceicoccus esteveae TaxID=3075597 RepID=A0ABU2ZH04_9SPHN|nr:hypothetical protein [Croceicoccus sp. F390]MDT0575872.1 hypothetical protein [Croceicoccus sp. F390]
MGKLWALGTGTGDFYWYAEKMLGSGGAGSTLAEILSFMGTMMLQQAHSGYGLENGWGGGFQIAIWNGKTLELLDRILVCGWVAQRFEDHILVGRGPFFYLYYKDDDLVVCRLSGKDGGAYEVARSLLAKDLPPIVDLGVHTPDYTVDLLYLEGSDQRPIMMRYPDMDQPRVDLKDGQYSTRFGPNSGQISGRWIDEHVTKIWGDLPIRCLLNPGDQGI